MSSYLRLDAIEELRMRRWARENYVPRASRCSDWHPVIHEEMQSKDCEDLRAGRAAQSQSGSGVAPLGPPTRASTTFILHTSHPEMAVGSNRPVAPASAH